MNNLYDTVRKAMHKDWDPIGVSAFTQEMGEYDSYVAGLCELVLNNAREEQLFEYLWTVETVSISLPGNRQKTREFAKWICSLNSDQP